MYDLREIDAEINVVVIQDHRDISNQIAERLDHRHQSPQAFVIKDGKAIYHATHYGIDPQAIEDLLRI
jgi:bacillithiol system protein YtxJ